MIGQSNQNPSFLTKQQLNLASFIENLDQIQNKQEYKSSIQAIHSQIYQQYADKNYANNAITRQLYEVPNQQTVKVELPNYNSLIDSMLRTTLGCEEHLAQSYLQIIDNRSKVQQEEKQKRIQDIKKSFTTSNSYKDFIANSKAFNVKTKYNYSRPVIDNQHQSYLRTNLIYMQKPNDNNKLKQYHDKHTEAIAKKIAQIGGIEDTISFMEKSLQTNQLVSTKNRSEFFKENKQKGRIRASKQISKVQKIKKDELSWVNRYKQMRETITSKLFS